MSERTERELRQELAELRGDSDDGTAGHDLAVAAEDLSVEWREAEPSERPEGMSFDAGTGTVAYDAWGAQQDALAALGEDADGSDASGDGDSGGQGHDLVALLAGYGSGKSVLGARWLLAQALAYPGSHFLAMGTTFSEARASTFPKLFAQLPGENTTLRTASFNGPEQSPLVVDFNRQENRLTLANDSVITLGSADKWSRFAGSEFGGVWMDEPSHYGSDLFDLLEMMGSRLRGVDGPKRQLWTLTGAGYNAAYEILEQRRDSTGEPLGIDIEVIRASTLDNPYLSKGEKDRFRRQYEDTSREEQALHGGFAAAQGLVYSEFSRDTHVIPDGEARERVGEEWRVFGYDAGWSDPRVLLEIGRTSYDQLVVLDEFYESASHAEDAIRWLQAGDKPAGTIYAEHEPSDIDRFERAGYATEKANKSIDAGIAEVRRRLETDGNAPVSDSAGSGSGGFMVTRPRSTDPKVGNSPTRSCSRSGGSPGPGMVTPDPEPVGQGDGEGDDTAAQADADTDTDEGRVGLLVSENCEHLIQEFLSYKTEEVGTSAATDHCLDALRYACMGVAGNDRGGGRKLRSIPSTW